MKADLYSETGVGVKAAKACFCVAFFFTLMLLFNGSAMYRSAQLLEYGRAHDFWVAFLRPLARVSRTTGCDRLRRAAEATAGAWLNER
ncbi:MAG: hypothetical protein PHG96_14600 [Kiritimatiellae bacterium]|nr:hypothetical protein [Kiritimatiellia bacterium]